MQKSDRCWSDVLKDRGYSLGYVGKWHLDSPRSPYIECKNNRANTKWNEWCDPEQRHGFDYWYSYGTYDYHMTPMYWSTDSKREAFHFVKQWGLEHESTAYSIRSISEEIPGVLRKQNLQRPVCASQCRQFTCVDQINQKNAKLRNRSSIACTLGVGIVALSPHLILITLV